VLPEPSGLKEREILGASDHSCFGPKGRFEAGRPTYRVSFGNQKSSRDLGNRASLHRGSGCRWKKQPCTNMTLRRRGNTRSGWPGRPLPWSR